jgi:hypothetical protein
MIEPRSRLALTVAIASAQAATILLTWPLWQLREAPPNLPLVALPVPCGALLLATLAPVVRWPLVGAVAHAVALALACLLDVTRFSPAPVSLALLLVTTARPSAEPIARAHLGALWLWAGVGKLISPAFFASISPAIARALPSWMPARELVGPSLALAEVLLGLLALLSPFAPRRAGAAVVVLGPIMHGAALVTLVLAGLNRGVWAWNAALALLALALFHRPATSPSSPGWALVPSVVLWLLPAGYPLGLHPTLAHQLYTGATPATLTCRAAGCAADTEARAGLSALGVPVPPSVGTLRAYFEATCEPGDLWLARSRLPGAGYDAVISEASCSGLR